MITRNDAEYCNHVLAIGLYRHGRRAVSLFMLLALSLGSSQCLAAEAKEDSSGEARPNILWITAEDMSPTLGCYGDAYAKTPNIDRLAEESVRYTNAFATAPVCSPSRSCLITGCFATSLGTQQMRSAFLVPGFMEGFPSLLRKAGYYTTNNYKTDYNTSSAPRIIKSSWNESSETAHWRRRSEKDRDATQPFFSIFNLMTSHQSRSMVWSQDRFRREVQSKVSQGDVHDPDEAPVPPYYPDTLVTRRIVARYYDCVTAMDAQVGEILRELEEDGLADDTIVFFYSDHGSGMPRHKRLLHDSGMHVPLLVRFPKKWADLAPQDAGESTDRLVSFVDFPPTVLKLAGVEKPEYMQGTPFLGAGADGKEAKRQYVFAHRDRIDEVFDCSRSVRDKQFLYIRNYMPHRSWNQYSSYSDLSEIRHELYSVAENESGTAAQTHYVGSSKPPEELYDCVADPHNLKNLAADVAHVEKLRELRDASRKHILDTRDVGFLPESLAWKVFGKSTPWEVARTDGFDEHSLSAWTADSLLSRDEEHFVALLDEESAAVRYWGVIGLANEEALSAAARKQLRAALNDASSAVRIESAGVLTRHGEVGLALPVLTQLLGHSDLTIVLHATRTIELLGEKARQAIPAMQKVAARAEKLQASTTQAVFEQSNDKDLAMFCSFSANGFLGRINTKPWQDLLQEGAQSDWLHVNEGVQFDAKNNAASMLSEGKNLWIIHSEEFADFELTADVKMPVDEYNAGIAFRCQVEKNGRPKGYQCEIAEELSGMLYAIGSGGWVWPKGDAERKQFFEQVGSAFRPGRWNHFRVRCEGERIRIWVNGILATDQQDGKHQRGRIALQHHGKGGTHVYRNVRARALNDPS